MQRVPTPFRVLNEAFAFGERSLEGGRLIDCDADECPGLARVSPIAKTRGKKREVARLKALSPVVVLVGSARRLTLLLGAAARLQLCCPALAP